MPSDESVFTRLVARVVALLPVDWRGHAGSKFKQGTQAISTAAIEAAEEVVDLASRKVTGLAEHVGIGVKWSPLSP